MIRNLAAAVTMSAASLSALAAPLSLTGKTVGYQYLYPNTSTTLSNTSFVVGAGVERTSLFGESPSLASVDLSDGLVAIDFNKADTFSQSAFNGIRLYDVSNMLDDITSVALTSATTLTPFALTFDANNIYINWQGQTVTSEDLIQLRIEGPSRTDVPEPATFALAAVALLGLRLSRRKKV